MKNRLVLVLLVAFSQTVVGSAKQKLPKGASFPSAYKGPNFGALKSGGTAAVVARDQAAKEENLKDLLKAKQEARKAARKSSFDAGVTLEQLAQDSEAAMEELKDRRLTRSSFGSLDTSVDSVASRRDSKFSVSDVKLVNTQRPATGGKLVLKDTVTGRKTKIAGRRKRRLEAAPKALTETAQTIRQIAAEKAEALKQFRIKRQRERVAAAAKKSGVKIKESTDSKLNNADEKKALMALRLADYGLQG